MTPAEPFSSPSKTRQPASRHAGRVPPAVGWGGWLLAVLAVIAGLAVGAWATQHWLGRQIRAQAEQAQQTLQQALERTRTELLSAQSRANSLSAQLVIERSTNQGLQAELQKAQSDLGAERDKVAFYEQLLPPGPQGSIAVRGLEIERQGPNLLYRAVIMRNSQAEQPFKGRLQFIAHGVRQGKAVQIELAPARASSPTRGKQAPPEGSSLADQSGMFDVAFEQFQRSTGLLQIPPGFLPQTITLNVLQGDTVRASRSVKIGPVETD